MSPYEKDAFQFCPVCGGKFQTNSVIEKQCTNCGYIYFIAAKPAAGALVIDESGAMLLIRRNRNPYKDTLDIPAGFSDDMETLEDTLKREMMEEVGLNTDEVKCEFFKSFIGDYDYKGVTKRFLSAIYIIRIDDSTKATLNPGSDASEIVFIKPEEMNMDEIGFPEVKKLIKDYQAYLNL
jgi:NAD+ diphosphatase